MNKQTIKGIQLISIENFLNCLDKNKFQPTQSILSKIKKSENFLIQKMKTKEVIYGINTGFGPLANQRIPIQKLEAHQKNLIYHLSTGLGDPYPISISRSIFLARIICLSKGYSGISYDNFIKMIDIFNAGLIPYIPSKGTVGASGDLTPLSHLALSLVGEGYFIYKNQKVKSNLLMNKMKLPKINLKNRDALSLVNGTSAMVGIACINYKLFKNILNLVTLESFFFSEILNANEEVFSMELAFVKKSMGQKKITSEFQKLMKSSSRLKTKKSFFKKDKMETQENIQDPYTIRTLPQVLGSVLDTFEFYKKILEEELNSVSDNPILIEKKNKIVHGGNFQGTSISLISDLLNNSLLLIASLLERQIARLTDSNLNKNLPAFLNYSETGFNSGLMGAQVTATSLLAELRIHSTPASIQSISTNANNQDIVSMGTISAYRTYLNFKNVFYLSSILSICLAQAYDLSEDQNSFSKSSSELYKKIRKIVQFIDKDRSLSEEIENLSDSFIEYS
jgi:tyrosine ammonia-lyase